MPDHFSLHTASDLPGLQSIGREPARSDISPPQPMSTRDFVMSNRSRSSAAAMRSEEKNYDTRKSKATHWDNNSPRMGVFFLWLRTCGDPSSFGSCPWLLICLELTSKKLFHGTSNDGVITLALILCDLHESAVKAQWNSHV
jgi:hypothetical protein